MEPTPVATDRAGTALGRHHGGSRGPRAAHGTRRLLRRPRLRRRGASHSDATNARRAEDVVLAPGATRAVAGGRRAVPEEPDPWRTCFERDRDRILHSSAFRRLAGKTQVFVFPADHQRTRLSHALEVAQVATGIAQACRLNVALTEAIALGHDCGHGPGGHMSEDALGIFLPDGFDHAVWGADVSLADLNLCEETLDGIRNHSWSRPAPSTPEGEVVSWADRIAYLCHDWEDAVSAGIVTPALLPDVVLGHCAARPAPSSSARSSRRWCTPRSRTGRVGMDEELAEALAAFRRCNYEQIYLRPASVTQGASVVSVLRALVAHFTDQPNLIPGVRSGGGLAGGSDARCLRGRRLRGGHDRPLRHGHRRLGPRLGSRPAAPGSRLPHRTLSSRR